MRLRARLANALHFAGQPNSAWTADRARAGAGPPRRRSDSRCSTRWRAATPRCCSARGSARAAADRGRVAEIADASTSRELQALGLHWRLYDLLEAGRRRAPPTARSACAPSPRSWPADLPLPRRALGDVIWAMIGDRLARGAGPDQRMRTSSASAPAARRWSSSPPASTPGSPTAPARWATSRQRSPRRSRATRSSCVNLPVLALAHLQAGDREAARRDLRALRRRRLRRDPARHALDGRDGRAHARLRAARRRRHAPASCTTLLLPYRERSLVIGIVADCWAPPSASSGCSPTIPR